MKIKEIFYSIQGEGYHSGRATVFCRFSGCNLWTGRQKDRHKAHCKFCDTDFLGGDKYSEAQLTDAIERCWVNGSHDVDGLNRFVVLTGGEPALQVTESLIVLLQDRGFLVAIETNGTIKVPASIDWVTVSPKAGTKLLQTHGDELKVVWPQDFDLHDLESFRFEHRYLQPMDGMKNSIDLTVRQVLTNNNWRLSLQLHKIIGVE